MNHRFNSTTNERRKTMKLENFTISAEVRNKDYSVDTAVTEQDNEFFVSHGLKNYCKDDDVVALNKHNNDIINAMTDEQYNQFSLKCVELISKAFTKERLTDICFQTHCATETHFLK